MVCMALMPCAIAAPGAVAQTASIVKFPELAKLMSVQNDTTYIFNFFATWCEPCVKEFPSFQSFADKNASQKLRVIFFSLDFKKDYRKRLLPFLKSHHVKNTTLLLNETDYNSWIDKIDSTWDGDLPATLIINNAKHKREIYHREMSYAELDAAVKPFLP